MNELRIRNDHDVSSELSAFFFRTMVDANRDLQIRIIGIGGSVGDRRKSPLAQTFYILLANYATRSKGKQSGRV